MSKGRFERPFFWLLFSAPRFIFCEIGRGTMIARVVLGAVLASAAFSVNAQDDAVARSLAATCANCHGTDGRSVTKEVPALPGRPKEVLGPQIKRFQERKR